MTMNPTTNHENKVNPMDENKVKNSAGKTSTTQNGGAMHGGNGIGGNGVGTKTPQHNGGTTPIFIDIENLDLTVICGNQENYHENINGGFGCMQGSQQMGCGCEGCDEDCDCYDEDWDDDDFDEPDAPEDEDPSCNTCDFSQECLKNSIESGDNIFLDQIIRKMAFIADVPISTAMMVLNAYLTLCSIFDEEPPVRLKKHKYDVHRIPVGLDDLTNRIHKAATALAYELAETEGAKGNEDAQKGAKALGAKPATPVTQKDASKKSMAAPASAPEDTSEQKEIDDVLSLLPDSFKEVMKDAPEMMKKLVDLLSDKGNAVRIYRVEVMKKDETSPTEDTDQDNKETKRSEKGEVNSHE